MVSGMLRNKVAFLLQLNLPSRESLFPCGSLHIINLAIKPSYELYPIHFLVQSVALICVYVIQHMGAGASAVENCSPFQDKSTHTTHTYTPHTHTACSCVVSPSDTGHPDSPSLGCEWLQLSWSGQIIILQKNI